MRTPSIVPHDAERDTYLVLGDFGVDSVALGARPTLKALIAPLCESCTSPEWREASGQLLRTHG